MSDKHYNMTAEPLPCSVVAGNGAYIYADHYTTVKHEAVLRDVNAEWIMWEEREYTVVADTDGGCDRTETEYFEHPLEMENAVFADGKIVGFYYEYPFYNGTSAKPNAHVFLFDSPETLRHYNGKSTFELRRKV